MLENLLKLVLEIVYSALNGCRPNDLILAYADIEYPKIGCPIVYAFFLDHDASTRLNEIIM